MRRWLPYVSGVLIGVGIATVPSVAIVESYVGGSALHGYVKDGRYFVVPGHGLPDVEVSRSRWLAVYWVEVLWPWMPIILIWAGLFLSDFGKRLGSKPPPPRESRCPRLATLLRSTGGTVAGSDPPEKLVRAYAPGGPGERYGMRWKRA